MPDSETSAQFFRSSRRVKMSFLCKKGRAATLLLCAYCFKKGNASRDFELDEIVNRSGGFFLFRFRPRVVNKSFARLRCCPKVHKGTTT